MARQLLPAHDADRGAHPADDWIVRWLAEAGPQLVGQAPHVAIPLLRWVVAGTPAGVAPHDLLTSRLAEAMYRAGDPRGATRVALGALAHVNQPDLLVELHWTLMQCRAAEGRSDQCLGELEHAMRAPGITPRQRARLLVLTARVHRNLGHVEVAGQIAEEALAEATAAGDRWAMGWALGVQTIVHGMQGDTARALPLFERALAVAEGDPALADLRLLMQVNQAVALGDLDRYDDAIAAAEQVRQLADAAGNTVRLAQAQSVLGELLFDVGRWDDALAEIDVGPDGLADPVVECTDHGLAATIQLHRGDRTAGDHLSGTERYAPRLADRVIGPLALARSLELEQAGAPDKALAVLTDGLSDTAEEMEENGSAVVGIIGNPGHNTINRAAAKPEVSGLASAQYARAICATSECSMRRATTQRKSKMSSLGIV